ncbi:MAG: hypothetical protein V1944_02290 [Candidatus Aenigmatarchaeota archaeon]
MSHYRIDMDKLSPDPTVFDGLDELFGKGEYKPGSVTHSARRLYRQTFG